MACFHALSEWAWHVIAMNSHSFEEHHALLSPVHFRLTRWLRLDANWRREHFFVQQPEPCCSATNKSIWLQHCPHIRTAMHRAFQRNRRAKAIQSHFSFLAFFPSYGRRGSGETIDARSCWIQLSLSFRHPLQEGDNRNTEWKASKRPRTGIRNPKVEIPAD